MTIKAFVVEFIQQLWRRGYLRGFGPLVYLRDLCLEDWVKWKAKASADEVVAANTPPPPVIPPPEFTEARIGETDLGGFMRLRAPWSKQIDPAEGPQAEHDEDASDDVGTP